jgi:hypothetical protein
MAIDELKGEIAVKFRAWYTCQKFMGYLFLGENASLSHPTKATSETFRKKEPFVGIWNTGSLKNSSPLFKKLSRCQRKRKGLEPFKIGSLWFLTTVKRIY